GLHRAPAPALARAVREVEEPRGAGGRRDVRAPARRGAAAGTGDDRARRLPARQHNARRRRARHRRARLGDLHAGRPARRRGPVDGLLDRSRRWAGRVARLLDTARGVPAARRDEGSLCRADGARSVGPRLLRRVRLLEARVHPRGRVRSLRRRRGRRRPLGIRGLRRAGRKPRPDGTRRCRGRRPLSDLYELRTRPEELVDFHEPVLVIGLEGWIDARLRAATAMAALLAATGTEVVATFDADDLLDHRSRRPVLRISEGVNTGLTWPEIELRAGRDPLGTPVLALTGPEPDHRWRAFTDAVAELAALFDVRLAVGLGAFPAPVPHTRPCRLAATATTPELAGQVGYVGGTLEVPAGVEAALEARFAAAGLPAVGLWARVPHY